ncbi:nucleotidyl transferase AbiEii/AbiGii toxin family protein [Thermococcus nautili]|uniref:nucleotidyl transferase AbiEii/AbiGii toxin family protein n=1 Tax=Thermococcus nautili TaxID=195522 RepID=UPI00146F97D3|nr:nucleotidyl transferase AbiEii/AbiGii toxin family protein [Thermococcus nautili]
MKRDVLLHAILRELYGEERFHGRYLFKGGTCLVKCYLGYYRFSVDLDFTFPLRGRLSRSERRKLISSEVRWLSEKLSYTAEELGLDFRPFEGKAYNQNFVHFEGNENRKIVFFHLFMPTGEVVKIEVNFFEPVLFEEREVQARTLLWGVKLTNDEKAYFFEELERYSVLPVMAYSPEEILAEKIRAILTRRIQKLRDFYDVFMLYRAGYDYSNVIDEAIEKVQFSMRFSPTRTAENLRVNLESIRAGRFNVDPELMEKELELVLTKPPESEFQAFIKDFLSVLSELEFNDSRQ